MNKILDKIELQDGKIYDLQIFSDDIKNAVQIFNAICDDLQIAHSDFVKAQKEIIKCTTSLNTMKVNLLQALNAELKDDPAKSDTRV